MPPCKQSSFMDVLNAWATDVPPDMIDENPRDKLLDSFLRLFENLSAAEPTELPPRRELFQSLRRAMHWQWIALNISMPPLAAAAAPHILTVAIVRWLTIWRSDKTPGKSRLMAAIDRDLQILYTAAQHVYDYAGIR